MGRSDGHGNTIYLSHFQFGVVSTRIFGESPALASVFAIIGGVLVWRIYERVEAWFRQAKGRPLREA